MNTIWRVSTYLLRYRLLFLLTLSLALGSTFFAIMVPKVIRGVINEAIQAQSNTAMTGALLVAICYFGRELLNSLRIRVNNTLEQKVLFDLRSDLHRKLMDLPVSYFDGNRSGEIASRVTEDVQTVERALLDGTEQGLSALLMILGIMMTLLFMEPLLALFVILPLPVVISLSIWHASATRKNWKAVRESSGEMNSLLIEDIQANRLIHSFALKDREHGRFQTIATELKQRTLVAMYRWSLHGPFSAFISSLGMVSVVGIGGYLITHRPHFQTGDLVAFFLYAGMLYEPIRLLTGLNHMISAAIPCGKRVFEILDHPVLVFSPEKPVSFPETSAMKVAFENVEFAYPERNQILHQFNLTLNAGQTTAIVGSTGAGKSTVANLLMRYYDVHAGTVRINGTDLRSLNLETLRAHIGYVSQDPFLFDGTVEFNLQLGKSNASHQEMVQALIHANAWNFVRRLPNGLQTQIGEKGIRLSMGEKQRLTIARMILKSPPIIILDEATSSVDTLTERSIQEALEALMKNRTVLMIAHRLSTIRNAHQIVVLDQGSIIERGTHDTLLRHQGVYARMWQHQSDWIIP
jgi:ABC-type multidrug transport system fused ATPase/permease subunit